VGQKGWVGEGIQFGGTGRHTVRKADGGVGHHTGNFGGGECVWEENLDSLERVSMALWF
jgi:hypothetical protein